MKNLFARAVMATGLAVVADATSAATQPIVINFGHVVAPDTPKGRSKRFAARIAKKLTPKSRDAPEPFGPTGVESRPIPRVLARRSQFASLLTVPDLALALERNSQMSGSGRSRPD
jgi:hypothetical protein